MKFIKARLVSAALVLVACSNVRATEALFFDGGGYTIEVLIGLLDEPITAQIRFTPPRAKQSVIIPNKLLYVEKFDMKKRILVMRFSNRKDPDFAAFIFLFC